jgi:hypothetical protein
VTGAVKSGGVEKKFASPFFWPGLIIVAVAFLAGAGLTWRRWPDLVIDFGPQLYMPWRIATGAVLYRDLYYFSGGPLSQYFHAALFQCFGISFLTLIISNLAITAAMLAVIYHQFSKAADALTGTAIALAVVVIFAFAQYTGIGNNNYAAPYAHELLHGLSLSIFAVALLARWLETKKLFPLTAAGFCFGLVLLTKPEIFAALALTTLAAFALAGTLKAGWKFSIQSLAGFGLAATAAPAGFFLVFLRTESWQESLRLEFFDWRALLCDGVLKNSFYQWSLGLDAPWEHLQQTAIHFLTVGLVVAGGAASFRKAKSLSPTARRLANWATLAVLWFAATKFSWIGCGASLPLLGVVAGALLLRQFQNGQRQQAVVFPLLWSIFALGLLVKQGLFPRIWHTGFALAMPAFVSAVFLFLWLLPETLEERRQVPRRLMRLAAFGVLVVACIQLAHLSAQFYSAKNLRVGTGSDQIRARRPDGNAVEARNFNLALDWIEKNVPPPATLAAIPQGALLNFLSRRANSTPCLDWNPTLFAVFGATNMFAALTQHPPDYIALVEWQTFEFDAGYFGTAGFGDDVMAWVRANYQPVALFGSEPLRNGLFGIKILKFQPANTGTNNIEKPPTST